MNIKPIDTELLRVLWTDAALTIHQICERVGVAHDTLYKHAKRMQLPRRPRVERYSDKDPTIDEIRERAAAIRESWSEEERDRRQVGGKPCRWTPPCVGRELLCLG